MTPFWTVVAAVAGLAIAVVAILVAMSLAYITARVLVRAQLAAESADHKSDSGDPRPSVDPSAKPQADPRGGHRPQWYEPFVEAATEAAAASDASIEGRGELMAVIPAGSIGVEVRKVKVSELSPAEKAEIDAQVDREMETAAKQAVADTGLTGPDADRLFQGIMEGIARAKASGKSHGTIAIAMNPGTLDPVGVKLGPPMADGLAHPGRRVAIRSQDFDFNDGKPVS